jgi:hypothetical protein
MPDDGLHAGLYANLRRQTAQLTRHVTVTSPPRRHARSEGSVFFAGRRTSGDNCAKIHDEAAVMMPTQRNVAWNAGTTSVDGVAW